MLTSVPKGWINPTLANGKGIFPLQITNIAAVLPEENGSIIIPIGGPGNGIAVTESVEAIMALVDADSLK